MLPGGVGGALRPRAPAAPPRDDEEVRPAVALPRLGLGGAGLRGGGQVEGLAGAAGAVTDPAVAPAPPEADGVVLAVEVVEGVVRPEVEALHGPAGGGQPLGAALHPTVSSAVQPRPDLGRGVAGPARDLVCPDLDRTDKVGFIQSCTEHLPGALGVGAGGGDHHHRARAQPRPGIQVEVVPSV